MLVGHPRTNFAGAQIGRYFNVHGEEVSSDLARLGGFDVEKNRVEKRRAERKAKALAEIDALYQAERARVEAEAVKDDAEPRSPRLSPKVTPLRCAMVPPKARPHSAPGRSHKPQTQALTGRHGEPGSGTSVVVNRRPPELPSIPEDNPPR
jgi:hypothetical protein